MNKTILVTILIMIAFSMVICQPNNRVPYGAYILSNGIFEESEWSDSQILKLDLSNNLMIKQDDKNIFIGIEFLNEKHTGIDLYLANKNGKRFMFHISSTPGEKMFLENEWTETQWVLTKYWSCNTVGIYIDENGKRHIIEPNGFEFQISKKIIEDDDISIRIHLKRPEKIYPENTTEINIHDWYKFIL